MTTYAWPEAWQPSRFEATLVPNDRRFRSPFSQAEQVADLLGERWQFVLTLPPVFPSQQPAREAYLARLRGGAHTISMWHLKRPQPRGTMRGTPTLAAAAAQGADAVSIQGAAGETLYAGDLFGLAAGTGTQLLMVAADVTANGAGVMSVALVNRLRVGAASGAAVTWDRPSVLFRLQGAVPVAYAPGVGEAIELQLQESWGA